MIFSHSGDQGDLIAALAVVRNMDGGDLVLYPHADSGNRMTPERVQNLRAFLEAQSYISSVTWAPRPSPYGVNLDSWRHSYRQDRNLTDMYFEWLKLPKPDRAQPWLWVDPDPVAEVVFARSGRYHNGTFPWGRALKKYVGRAVFIGTNEEHQIFTAEFGPIPHHQTPDMLAVARAVAGAKLVIVNQTATFWVAEGLKRPLVLEAHPQHPNCHWQRHCWCYGLDEMVEMPDIDQFDERLAVSIADRSTGRSLVDCYRRRNLARLALTVAGLSGDAAELGVFEGGTAAIIAGCLPKKTVHLFDTFSGLPADDVAGGHREGEFAAARQDVERFLRGCKVEFHQGFFPATAADLAETRFAFVHIDGDLYQTTLAAIAWFWPRMVPGGVMVFDDYKWANCPGVERAIRESGLAVQETAQQAWATK